MRILTSREQVLPLVREWLELLAQNNYEEAFGWLYHLPGEIWTPSVIRQLIENYGSLKPTSDGRTFHVTSLTTAANQKNSAPYQDVLWFDDAQKERIHERVGMVHFDIPLNDEWSDLTVIFWVTAHGQNYVLQLEDMRVL